MLRNRTLAVDVVSRVEELLPEGKGVIVALFPWLCACFLQSLSSSDFIHTASDGHEHTVRQIAAGRPLFMVYFATEDGDVGVETVNRLHDAFRGKVKVIGVTTEDLQRTVRFCRKFHAEFLIVSDEGADLLMLREEGAIYGLDNWLVSPKGIYIKSWAGLSRESIEGLKRLVRKRFHVRLEIKLSILPKAKESGRGGFIDLAHLPYRWVKSKRTVAY